MPRLLFISNLFPTGREPYRGLDNATLLHALAAHFDIRVLSPRPTLPLARNNFSPRPEDSQFQPCWVPSAYIPKIGGHVNHLLMVNSIGPAFEQTLRAFAPEVILSSWIFPDSCAVLRLVFNRLPVVAIAQGSDIHTYLNMRFRRRVILKTLPRATAVVTRSHELSRILESCGFPAAKLHTVYNGVDLDLFQPRDQAVARRETNLPAGARVILFVGNFYPVKNPLHLIRAIAQIDSAILVMAGGGPLESAARALASSLNIDSRVIFAGRKTPGEIARLMNAADLLAIPSTNEGVPNVILEAFASSLPVVASNVGGIPEVLNAPSVGRLVPSNDLPALVSALRDQLATPRDAPAIRRHGGQFSWEAAASGYREILTAAMQ